PRTIIAWNANGLTSRLTGEPTAFLEFMREHEPDVLCIQEVRLPAHGPPKSTRGDGAPRNRGTVKAGTKTERADSDLLTRYLNRLSDYEPVFSLADTKYAGTAMLISRRMGGRRALKGLRFSLDWT
ncbi:unnamed protein product, partial [Phaeothamnion confervicola]